MSCRPIALAVVVATGTLLSGVLASCGNGGMPSTATLKQHLDQALRTVKEEVKAEEEAKVTLRVTSKEELRPILVAQNREIAPLFGSTSEAWAESLLC